MWKNKVVQIRQKLQDKDVYAVVIAALDEVACKWFLKWMNRAKLGIGQRQRLRSSSLAISTHVLTSSSRQILELHLQLLNLLFISFWL